MAVKWTKGPVIQDAAAFWEIEGQVFDPVPVYYNQGDGKTFRPLSYQVMCPHCGALWARRTVTYGDPIKSPFKGYLPQIWSMRLIHCKDCKQDAALYAGGLWQSYDPGWNASLPYAALIREIFLITAEKN